MTEERASGKSGSGCLKAAGIGCSVVLLLLGIATYFVVKNSGKILQSVSSTAIVAGSEAMFNKLNLPEEEKKASLVHIHNLTKRIKNGEVTLEQAGEILESLANGPLPVVMTLRFFEVQYLAKSTLSDQEKKAGHVTLTRFAKGLTNESIDMDEGTKVADIITEKTKDLSGKETSKLKETITDDELKKCLTLMKSSADKANIEDREFKVDVAEEIRRAIEKGLMTKSSDTP